MPSMRGVSQAPMLATTKKLGFTSIEYATPAPPLASMPQPERTAPRKWR